VYEIRKTDSQFHYQLAFFLYQNERRERRVCVLLQITKEDALPKNICQRCVYKLDMFYEFRVSCIATETKLKNYADSLKNITSISNQVSKSFDRSIRARNDGSSFLPLQCMLRYSRRPFDVILCTDIARTSHACNGFFMWRAGVTLSLSLSFSFFKRQTGVSVNQRIRHSFDLKHRF